MKITDKIEDAAEFDDYEDATCAAMRFEGETGYDTRLDATAEGHVIRVLDEEGDALGYAAWTRE